MSFNFHFYNYYFAKKKKRPYFFFLLQKTSNIYFIIFWPCFFVVVVVVVVVFFFFFSLTLYFWNSKFYSRFLTSAYWYLLSILYIYFLYNLCDFVVVVVFLFLSLFPFFFSLTLYFWNSKHYSRFLIFAFMYLSPILYL